MRRRDFLTLHDFVLTDRVSGMSRFCGRGEGAESKSVLSSDSEQVILSFKQAGNNVGLAGTGSIHLKPSLNQSQPRWISFSHTLFVKNIPPLKL